VPSLPSSAAVTDKGLAPLGALKAGEQLDEGGLPHVGAVIWPGETYYTTQDQGDKRFSVHKLKGEEVAQVGRALALCAHGVAGCSAAALRCWGLLPPRCGCMCGCKYRRSDDERSGAQPTFCYGTRSEQAEAPSP
jgi:hypothetical protein